ncbi:MAG: sulfatase [Bacteroidota bacterium]
MKRALLIVLAAVAALTQLAVLDRLVKRYLSVAWLTLLVAASGSAQPRNVVVILSDDHRFDFMGFHPDAPDWLRTPHMDRMRAEGTHLENAFVTTSLCSPSRASILTGQYAHNHGVVDNTSPIPEGTRFFPQDLQAAGYETAYVGKWHMGEVDDAPQPGFDRWVSFRGQGPYFDPLLNIDGTQVPHEGYTTDLLTDYAVAWLDGREGDRPFYLQLSHKAVHAEFSPAPRHAGAYADVSIPYPATFYRTERNTLGKPHWVRAQRGSWHGVDFMFHGDLGPGLDGFDTFYRRYTETLLALDESVGRVLDALVANGLAESTLVLYLGDNGFLLGEHGLIDKRNAYEESIRIPMLAWAPGFIEAGSTVGGLVRNLDLAPTFLELTGADSPIDMDGASFLDLLAGGASGSDREFLYEYYWEYAFPHTPTTFALRGARYKFVYYHGVWDTEELYDIVADPEETTNLAPAMPELAAEMRERLFDRLEEDGAMRVPMRRGNWNADDRLLYD